MHQYKYNLGISFSMVSDEYKDKIAIKYPDGASFSYSQLNETSNRIARYLQKNKVSKTDVVAVFNEKSFDAYSLMLACLKIGAIYTNLDISSPWLRIEKIILTCKPKLIFYDGTENEVLQQIKLIFGKDKLINLSSSDFLYSIQKEQKSNLTETTTIQGNSPAYIMFTSGSTGFPKGAVMSHANVLNFIEWGKETFNISSNDVFTNANPIYFDNSVFDFYTSLFSGATLVPLSSELTKNAQKLVEAIDKTQCTIWFSVPSLLVYLLTTKSLTNDNFKSIKRIAFGGEGFPKTKLKQLFDLYANRINLFNVYGPTECTCICSSYLISEKDFENMQELAPLGNLAPNFNYKIIPMEGSNSKFGELCLIGPNVGVGYYNDEERTQKAFIQNPDSPYMERMYKTGDVVEEAKNGYLHFKGRTDNQIKHMGYRVELEEIEAAFNSISYVNEVAVIYEKLTPELGQIKAFVNISLKDKTKDDITSDIKQILPPYMLPRVIRIMDALPKNQNGKVDRKQLANL